MAKKADDVDRLFTSILAALFIAFVALLPACGWTFKASSPSFDSTGIATDGRRFVDLYLKRDARAIEAVFDPEPLLLGASFATQNGEPTRLAALTASGFGKTFITA